MIVCIHKHTYSQTRAHTDINTYMNACELHACCLHAYTQTNIFTYINAIHTHTYADVHTYIYTGRQADRLADMKADRHAGRHADRQTERHTCIHAYTHKHRHTITKLHVALALPPMHQLHAPPPPPHSLTLFCLLQTHLSSTTTTISRSLMKWGE